MGASDLTLRSGACDLRASSTDQQLLLSTESGKANWRLLELFSVQGLPFEVEATWTAGSGVGARLLMTVACATRTCIFARNIQIQVRNLSDALNRVGVNAADGFAPTQNVYEKRLTCDGLQALSLPVVPFATHCQIHAADHQVFAGTLITVRDGELRPRGQFLGATLPPLGIPMGGARQIDVLTSGQTDIRAVYSLLL